MSAHKTCNTICRLLLCKYLVGSMPMYGSLQVSYTDLFSTGPARHVKIGVAAVGGIGVILVLATFVVLGTLLFKARKRKGADSQLPLNSAVPQTRWPGFQSSREVADAGLGPTPSGIDIDAGASKESPPHDAHGAPPIFNVSARSAVARTALELLEESLTLSHARGDTPGSPQDAVLVVVGTGADSAREPHNATYLSPDHDADLSVSRHSEKTDSARTFHSQFTRSRAGTKVGEAQGVSKVGEEPHHEELWTRGVNPADVHILRDTRGQPVVLGRGAYAIVYLGRWQATLVAVKVMLANDSDAAQREVQAEADILRALRHPNVVLLMAICISPGQQVLLVTPETFA
jgi:hypothetical protein